MIEETPIHIAQHRKAPLQAADPQHVALSLRQAEAAEQLTAAPSKVLDITRISIGSIKAEGQDCIGEPTQTVGQGLDVRSLSHQLMRTVGAKDLIGRRIRRV